MTSPLITRIRGCRHRRGDDGRSVGRPSGPAHPSGRGRGGPAPSRARTWLASTARTGSRAASAPISGAALPSDAADVGGGARYSLLFRRSTAIVTSSAVVWHPPPAALPVAKWNGPTLTTRSAMTRGRRGADAVERDVVATSAEPGSQVRRAAVAVRCWAGMMACGVLPSWRAARSASRWARPALGRSSGSIVRVEGDLVGGVGRSGGIMFLGDRRVVDAHGTLAIVRLLGHYGDPHLRVGKPAAGFGFLGHLARPLAAYGLSSEGSSSASCGC